MPRRDDATDPANFVGDEEIRKKKYGEKKKRRM